MKKNNLFLAIIFMLLLVSCGSERSKKGGETNVVDNVKGPAPIKMVEVPVTLTNPDERLGYIIKNYWAKVDFSDTTYVSEKTIIEQAYVDYLNIMLSVPDKKVSVVGMDTLMSKAERGCLEMYNYMIELNEKYLYEPNSPFRNEDLYIGVLNHVVGSQSLDETSKVRPKYQLNLAMKNRPGTKAADFKFKTESSGVKTLHGVKSEYTVLLFYNLGCPMCKQVKTHIMESPVFENSKVKIISIYPDKEEKEWLEQNNTISKEWINGIATLRDKSDKSNEIYDLRAIPCLYLLGSDKTVLLKDQPVEYVEQYLLNELK